MTTRCIPAYDRPSQICPCSTATSGANAPPDQRAWDQDQYVLVPLSDVTIELPDSITYALARFASFAPSAQSKSARVYGATAATPCPIGTYQPTAGQSSCPNAPPGSFVSATGATTATPCAVGTYQPVAGQSSCLAAPLGSYVSTTGATAATACPAGMTTLATGSASIAECRLSSPTREDQCRRGGWQNYADANGVRFKNQGDCLKFVARV